MKYPHRVAAPWLDDSNSSALGRAIARRAILDVGLLEQPPGSNRSPRIDDYLTECGSPLGSPWCAAAVAAWWRESGADIPPSEAASCDAWMRWAKKTGRWSRTPVPGAAVLYGIPTDAQHIECVVRVTPLRLVVGGNTAFTGYSREGIACDLKPLTIERLLGFVHPHPLTGVAR